MNPDEWLANFEATVADIAQKSAAFKENLEAAGATEASDDGAVRVTVAPNGALLDLTIADSAMRAPGADLASQIMRLAKAAQRTAAANVSAAFAPLAGTKTEPVHAATRQIPPRSDEDDEDFSSDRIFTNDDPD
jgi:DNA-binding protein YbaB